MYDAEFKTRHEALGLTLAWLAKETRVSLRQVQNWESGQSPVPEGVAAFLARLDAQIETFVERDRAAIKTLACPDGVLGLVRYRENADLWALRPEMEPLPATTHATLIERLSRDLRRRHFRPFIVYMAPNAYRDWLAGRENTLAARVQWASEQR